VKDGRAGGRHASRPQGRTVLVAHPSPDLYGSDRVALGTVEALVARGFRVVATTPSPGPLVAAVEAAGAEFVLCPSPVLRKSALRPAGMLRLLATTLRSVAAGLRLLRACRPDVVYVSTLTVPLWLVLARVTGRVAVCHVHEAESGLPRRVARALAAPLLLSSSIVVNSEFSRDVLVSALPRLRARSRVVPNPVPGPGRAGPARDELSGAVEVLYVGRLSPRKGPQVAVAAIGELRARGVDAHLRLLGSVFPGYEWFEDELRATVEGDGLEDRVTFLGFRPDIWPEVAASDVVVVPSVADEPFGNTAVEAVLGARPVVVSAAGGLNEAVDGYAAALTVPPGDALAIADAVEKLVADWPGYRDAAAADARVAADRHDPVRYGDRFAALVLDALQPAATVAAGSTA
jgi:glycosyltransferase involved in cell wall biosynthesis